MIDRIIDALKGLLGETATQEVPMAIQPELAEKVVTPLEMKLQEQPHYILSLPLDITPDSLEGKGFRIVEDKHTGVYEGLTVSFGRMRLYVVDTRTSKQLETALIINNVQIKAGDDLYSELIASAMIVETGDVLAFVNDSPQNPPQYHPRDIADMLVKMAFAARSIAYHMPSEN